MCNFSDLYQHVIIVIVKVNQFQHMLTYARWRNFEIFPYQKFFLPKNNVNYQKFTLVFLPKNKCVKAVLPPNQDKIFSSNFSLFSSKKNQNILCKQTCIHVFTKTKIIICLVLFEALLEVRVAIQQEVQAEIQREAQVEIQREVIFKISFKKWNFVFCLPIFTKSNFASV